MSAHAFRLPDLGEGLTEATIADWHVRVGDRVTVDQVVVEVETAKAVVEVPVPFAGTVIELHGAAGESVTVGAPLITVGDADDEQYRTEERAGSGNVLIGYGTSEPQRLRRRRASTPPPPAGIATPSDAGAAKVISPVVRKLARDNSVDLIALTATGSGGVITRADVEDAMTAPAGDDQQRIPITGLRKAIAAKLSTSRREIPDATTWVDVDATALLDAKRRIQETVGQPVSLLALLARFAVAALRQFPELNSSVDTARSEIIRYRHINLGIAVQTPRGLVVPVIEHADTLDLVAMSAALTDTTTAARDGALPSARLSGGTFTLNNYGVFGVDGSAPIINHPEAAILGVGRIIDRPWAVGGELCVRKITQVSLSFDHRVCDGGAAGGFLRLFADFIENPLVAMVRL